MNKREAMQKGPIFRIAALILGVMLAFNLLSFCVRLAGENRLYGYEYVDMQRVMEEGDYPELVNMVSRNRAQGIEPRKDTSEFEAIAAYYEAASLFPVLRNICLTAKGFLLTMGRAVSDYTNFEVMVWNNKNTKERSI